jgi:type I restriction enzyme S subunit
MMTRSEILLCDISEAIVDCEHKTAPTQVCGIPLIRTTDVQNGRLKLSSAKRVSESTCKEWSRRLKPKAEDIILAREAPVGEVGYVPKGERVCLGQRTVLIRINSKVAYPRYILYLLCTASMRHKMASLAAGSVVPHLNMEDIRALTIPGLPIIEDQKTIGDVLGSMDDKIELNEQMNETLEGIGHAIFKRWFVDFEFPNEEGKPYKSSGGDMIDSESGEIPRGWRTGPFSEFIDLNPARKLPKRKIAKKVGMADLAPWRPWIETFSEEEFSSGSRFKNGDVLFARITPSLEHGKTALVSFLGSSEVAFGSTEFIVLAPKKIQSSYYILSFTL